MHAPVKPNRRWLLFECKQRCIPSKMAIHLEYPHLAQIIEPQIVSECMSQILYLRVLTSVPLSRNLVSSFGRRIIETAPPSRQQYSYVYLPRSFTGTNRALSIHRPGVHSARGDIPGEDLLPAQEALLNPILTLNDPRLGDRICLLYTSPSPRDKRQSRMPSSA